MPVDFLKLTSTQLMAYPRETTVFLFPVGSLEDYGPHLPLGFGGYEVNAFSWYVAEYLEKNLSHWRTIVLPLFSLGAQTHTHRIAFQVSQRILRDSLIEMTRSLVKLGFFHFVGFSSQQTPRQLTAIEEVGKRIRNQYFLRNQLEGIKIKLKKKPLDFKPSQRRITFISAHSAMVSGCTVWRAPFWPDPIEHGGKRDVSVGLAWFPEQLIHQAPWPNSKARPACWKRTVLRLLGRVSGYWGDPQQAIVSLGRADFEAQLTEVFPKLKAVWLEGVNPNSLFRSWYSIIPLNQTFFQFLYSSRFWIVVILYISLIMIWSAFLG